MKTRTTKSIISGRDVLSRIPEEFARLWPGSCALIVADTNTWLAAGNQVFSLIGDAGLAQAEPFIFPDNGHLHGDLTRIAELVQALDSVDKKKPLVPVAVGSGTINDIVKRAAFERGLPYVCVPTAPSVDGYTSFGAAITVNGFKTTLPCDAPVLVVADEDVMACAPGELLAAGYGDLAAKVMSGRDWQVAEALGLDTIESDVWELSQGKLLMRLASPDLLARRDPGAVRGVFDGLCDTGLAMQDRGDSRPASGAEHHISHCWEMRGLQVHGKDVLHGQKVAAGTLLMAVFGEALFAIEEHEVRTLVSQARELRADERAAEVRQIFSGTGIGDSAVQDAVRVSLVKLVFGQERLLRLEKISRFWNPLRSIAFHGRPRYAELSSMFASAGCPGFTALGLDATLMAWGLHAAQTIRNRYTLLDLARDLGILDRIIDIVITKINV
jgi:glycerol-1-phosphate dehydrogenase [NAD(P)+]